MTTAATPDHMFAVVVDHTHKEFDVHGPMVGDLFLTAAVCRVQEAGFNVTTKTRPQRGPHETLEMAAVAFGRELALVHRSGLLRRLSAWAGRPTIASLASHGDSTRAWHVATPAVP